MVFTTELRGDLRADLRRGLTALHLEATEAQQDLLLEALSFLSEWNAVMNLTAIRAPHDMLVHHVLDSLSVLPHLPARAESASLSLLDVGSGGGFPALPIAVFRPDLAVVALDAVRKKTDFVNRAATYLALPNLRAVHSRVEDHRVTYDVVISRAYASLRDFVKSAGHTVKADGRGRLLAMKGKSPDEEVVALARTGWRLERQEALSVPLLDAARTLLWLERDTK